MQPPAASAGRRQQRAAAAAAAAPAAAAARYCGVLPAAARRSRRQHGLDVTRTRSTSGAAGSSSSSGGEAGDDAAPSAPPMPAAEAVVAAAADTAATSSTTTTTSSSSSPPSGNAADALGALVAAEPIDRLRYQALLMFDHWGGGGGGADAATAVPRLSGEQVQQFLRWSARKVAWSPPVAELLAGVEARHQELASAGATRDDFVRLVRDQVHAVSTSPSYQGSMLRPDVAARLQAQMSLTRQELAAAHWVFGLLDFDNDGKVSLAMYAAADGIEAYVYGDKLEDADADDDGLIVLEEFLGSYAKPKPILKNLVIMAANTLAIFLVLQASFLDVAIKVLLCGALVLKPQLVSRPAALLYDSVKAIIDQGRAQTELARSGRGVWRPA